MLHLRQQAIRFISEFYFHHPTYPTRNDIHYIWEENLREGDSPKIKSYVDMGRTTKFLLSLYHFLPNYPPSVYILFFNIKHPILTCPNWVLFTIICSKNTKFLNLGTFVLMNARLPIGTKFRKRAPQKADTYNVYHVNVGTPEENKRENNDSCM